MHKCIVPGRSRTDAVGWPPAVLADRRRKARADLGTAVDPDRAVDRQHGVVFERHQHLVVDHLPIGRQVVENADDAEHQPVAVKELAPFGEIPGGEDLVEYPDQFQRTRMSIGAGGKAGIGDEILTPEAARQRRPLPVLVEQGQDQPAPVLAPVVVGHRVQRVLARAPLGEFRAA